jgi:hypothetical protein
MTLILAGNQQEARNYLAENRLSPSLYRYIAHPDQLRGLHDIDLIRVGTWAMRPDIEQIEQALQSVGVE